MEDSDSAIVLRAREGDSEAFRVLVERHSRSVFRLAYRMTRSEPDAEDVVQETFVKVFKNLNSYEERANFSTWLFRIAANCSVDWLRRNRKHDEHRDEMNPDLENKLTSEDRRFAGKDELIYRLMVQQRVNVGYAALSAAEKSAFVLRHFEGWSVEEIGKSLGIGPNAVKNCVFRAVQKMRRALEPLVSVSK